MYWPLSFAAGWMMGAVSPAVIVPPLIQLSNKGYGTDKSIHGIAIAASSLDDILAITMFGIFLGIGLGGAGGQGVFGDNPLVNSIVIGPFGLIGGIILGILIGLVLRMNWFTKIPYKIKAAILTIMALALVFLFDLIQLDSLGFLASITSASIGATHWGSEEAERVESLVSYLWLVLQVPLFGLIGSALYFGDLNGEDVGLALIIILVGLIFRVPTAGLSMCGTNLVFKER